MQKVISNLPDLCRRHGNVTYTEISRQTGIAISTLSKLGTDKSKGMEFETMAKLCAFFKCQPGDLFRLVQVEAA
jgi:DNA-binding Xre family transcriptional regulator